MRLRGSIGKHAVREFLYRPRRHRLPSHPQRNPERPYSATLAILHSGQRAGLGPFRTLLKLSGVVTASAHDDSPAFRAAHRRGAKIVPTCALATHCMSFPTQERLSGKCSEKDQNIKSYNEWTEIFAAERDTRGE